MPFDLQRSRGLIIREHVEPIAYTDFQAAGTTQEAALTAVTTVPTFVLGAWAEVTTTFQGGSIATYELDIGGQSPEDSNDLTGRIDIMSATGNLWTPSTSSENNPTFYDGFTIRVKITTSGANIDQATQGAANLHFAYITMNTAG